MKEKWTCIQGRCVETIATPEVALQLVAIVTACSKCSRTKTNIGSVESATAKGRKMMYTTFRT